MPVVSLNITKAKEYGKSIKTAGQARQSLLVVTSKLGEAGKTLSGSDAYAAGAARDLVDNVLDFVQRITDKLEGKGEDDLLDESLSNQVGLALVQSEDAAKAVGEDFEDDAFFPAFVQSIQDILKTTVERAGVALGSIGGGIGSAVFELIKGLWPILVVLIIIMIIVAMVKGSPV